MGYILLLSSVFVLCATQQGVLELSSTFAQKWLEQDIF